jgi:hypothetical protein
MTVRCACGNKECKIKVYISRREFWFTDPEGKEYLMYLDANAIIEMMGELRCALLAQANHEEEE